ncbi:hypothetical protein [Emticicia sp. BO119]|uniref:hypothetical protein n=1 Tax=Emticicia sp. BO119 TaxID=2757768 RepID=UPI0015EFE980|nr:hypothetical protein [Emticicia sp. BO119]MBA4849365.1 hypothetical protein [Emticicia sp. BO119]
MKQCTLLGFLIVFFSSVSLLQAQQVADMDFSYPIKKTMYETGKGSTIVLDEAHYNFHTLAGRYAPFGQLLKKDGYVLKSGNERFTLEYLSNIKILVIANAMPDSSAEWKLPAKSAFKESEINALKQWVQEGGSLMLIADHMPFAGCSAQLSLAFGFNFIDGFAIRRDKKPEVFSYQRNNLNQNIITRGRTKEEKIDSLMVFTGQAFIAPKEATVLTRLNDEYEILMPSVAWGFNETTPRISGQSFVNGAFMDYGKGRLVVMGEAAMFSAQLSGPLKVKAGMNHPVARQNAQFLLNIVHWLDRGV